MIDEIILGVITFFLNQGCGSGYEKVKSRKVFIGVMKVSDEK
jgi:hypothetical protein